MRKSFFIDSANRVLETTLPYSQPPNNYTIQIANNTSNQKQRINLSNVIFPNLAAGTYQIRWVEVGSTVITAGFTLPYNSDGLAFMQGLAAALTAGSPNGRAYTGSISGINGLGSISNNTAQNWYFVDSELFASVSTQVAPFTTTLTNFVFTVNVSELLQFPDIAFIRINQLGSTGEVVRNGGNSFAFTFSFTINRAPNTFVFWQSEVHNKQEVIAVIPQFLNIEILNKKGDLLRMGSNNWSFLLNCEPF